MEAAGFARLLHRKCLLGPSIMLPLPGDDNKRDPERENLAVLTIAAQIANVIHIRVTFNAVTR